MTVAMPVGAGVAMRMTVVIRMAVEVLAHPTLESVTAEVPGFVSYPPLGWPR